jgi:hypothetical protein
MHGEPAESPAATYGATWDSCALPVEPEEGENRQGTYRRKCSRLPSTAFRSISADAR